MKNSPGYSNHKRSKLQSKSKSSKDLQDILKEKDNAKNDLYETSSQLEELKRKFNTIKQEHHTLSGDLERLRTEHFVTSQRLTTIETEHTQEIESYKEEIEELLGKVSDLERKLELAKEEAEKMSNSGEFGIEEGFGAEDLGLADHTDSAGDDHRRPSTARLSTMNREKRISFQTNTANSEFKSQLIKDVQNKELVDKNAELQQQLDDLKLANHKMKLEIDQINAKLKEEYRNLELAKKKIETKDLELENFRKKTLEDTDKFTIALNEVNEELDNRDEQIKKLRKQIRSLQAQSNGPTPPSPLRPPK